MRWSTWMQSQHYCARLIWNKYRNEAIISNHDCIYGFIYIYLCVHMNNIKTHGDGSRNEEDKIVYNILNREIANPLHKVQIPQQNLKIHLTRNGIMVFSLSNFYFCLSWFKANNVKQWQKLLYNLKRVVLFTCL